jgi:hypothetical protein
MGHVTKQGNTLLRWLLVEAATQAQSKDPSWHRQHVRLSMNKHHGVAKVAIAHKLAVSFVLDVALRAELHPDRGARFACGAVRLTRWLRLEADFLIGRPASASPLEAAGHC